MVKVIGIVGSPRKNGNTEYLVKIAMKSAEDLGADTEVILLSEKKLLPCDGCESCGTTGKCKINDDFNDLFTKMAKADAILLASPSYFESVTPHMKALIDRTGFYNTRALGRSAFTGKVGGAISVAYRTGLATTWCQMLIFILSQKMIVPGITSFANAIGNKPGDVMNDIEGIERARELGKTMTQLAQKLKN